MRGELDSMEDGLGGGEDEVEEDDDDDDGDSWLYMLYIYPG